MVHFVFFWSSIAAPLPPPHVCSTCSTCLINIFWAIHQELFFMSILKKIAKLQKKRRGGVFLEKLLDYRIQIC